MTKEKIVQIIDWNKDKFIVLTNKGKLFYGYLPYGAHGQKPAPAVWNELSLPPMEESE